MSYDIDAVSASLSADVIRILTALVTVPGSFVVMRAISLPLVLCMVVTIPLSVAFTRCMAGRPDRSMPAGSNKSED